MKRLLIALTALVFVDAALADNYVRPYVRRDGTVVQGHMRSSPNEYRFDNYSGRGNTNPYTGERGSQPHEFTDPPAFNRGHRRSPSTYETPRLGDPYGSPYSNPYRSPYPNPLLDRD